MKSRLTNLGDGSCLSRTHKKLEVEPNIERRDVAGLLLVAAGASPYPREVNLRNKAFWNPPAPTACVWMRALVEAGAPADIVLVRTTPVDRPRPAGRCVRRRRAGRRDGLRRRAAAGGALARPRVAFPGRHLPPSAVGALARPRDARLRAIGAEEEFRALKGGSHRDAGRGFLRDMRDLGRSAAYRWLEADLASVGVRSTMDLPGYAGSALGPIVGATPLAVS